MLIFDNDHEYYEYTNVARNWDPKLKQFSRPKRLDIPTVVVVNHEAIFAFDRNAIEVHLIYPKDEWRSDKLLGSFNELKNALLFAEIYEKTQL